MLSLLGIFVFLAPTDWFAFSGLTVKILKSNPFQSLMHFEMKLKVPKE